MQKATDSAKRRAATNKSSEKATQKTAAHKGVSKGVGRPKAAEVEARLTDLAQTAGRLILENGYSSVSLEMIAREARVAVRTIYTKFGGKAGILQAVMQAKRAEFFADMNMDLDPRPFRTVLDEFASRLYRLLTSPDWVALQRILAAEANSNPELIDTFFDNGPNVTREAIARYLGRPDVRAQLREDVPQDQLPVYLINCILGDQHSRVLRNQQEGTPEQCEAALRQRMALFYRSVLR
ncbi:MAG: TetR/AcrR family transcriptional regulator [Burkholderiales bacterium]|nr:TetR/AcrR family transcriptional regulator [Burkholderiales bacterium]